MRAAIGYFPTIFVLLWATGFIGAGYAMPHAEPFTFLAIRFALAAVLILAAALWAGAPWPSARIAMHCAIAGVLIHGAYLGGVFWAVRNGMPAGLSALIIGLQPPVTALVARAMLGEPLTARLFAGLALGSAGAALVIAPAMREGIGAAAAAATPQTLAACVGAVAAISVGTVWQKKYVTAADLRAGNFWQYCGACALTSAVALAAETRAVSWTGELVFALAWLTLVLSLGAVFLLMFLIRRGAVSKVASLFYLVPGVTAVMAWALFDETLTMVQIAGLLVAAAGVWLATRPSSPRNPGSA